MLQFAIDEKGEPISSFLAKPAKSYLCPECGHSLRLRKGERIRPHFFHLYKTGCDAPSGKSIRHQKFQESIRKQLALPPQAEEKIFPLIGRRADLVDERHKWVIEIQCSPLSKEETRARVDDYKKMGYRLIWLLDVHLFDRARPAPLEEFCEQASMLYIDFDDAGALSLYERRYLTKEGRFLWRSDPRKAELLEVEKGPLKGSVEQLFVKIGQKSLVFKGSLFEGGMLLEKEESSLREVLQKREESSWKVFKKLRDVMIGFCAG